ncbi:MAG: YdiU family protein [Bacteroidetes bacterium]|nr:MAG: YdiU family protein [Bacteroidota bacterium]
MKNPSVSNSYGFCFDNTYSQLDKKLFTALEPAKVKQPALSLWNDNLARELGLRFGENSKKVKAEIFSGNRLPDDSFPLAQAYAGHQFGHFTMLGDGRAILMGEQITQNNKRFDIQFKGSGQTPYSRRGDGRATLYSMLREYLISEAMHHLGIPTSRSLAVVKTGEEVIRETIQPGAVLTRVMTSLIRVGTFEYVRYLQPQLIEEFTRYVINRHFPDLAESENPALELFEKVMHLQIDLVVNWMRVGFIHGVMNTDNMSIPGETFDYGPCAFINAYHPRKVFSSIDHYGRYAFGNQPSIAQWNLGCLAVTLLPLIDEREEKATETAREKLSRFEKLFSDKYFKMMCNKLGIENPEENDGMLIEELLNWMQQHEADYTNTFLAIENGGSFSQGSDAGIYGQESFTNWYKRWEQRVARNQGGMKQAKEIIQQHNPAFIPRNHLVEEALEAAASNENYQPFHKLLDILSRPYDRTDELSSYQNPPAQGDSGYQTFCGT